MEKADVIYSEAGFHIMVTDNELYFEFDDNDGDGITHGCSIPQGGITPQGLADLFQKTQVWIDA